MNLDEPITVTLKRRQWDVLMEAASEYDRRLPKEQGDAYLIVEAVEEALER